MKIKIKKVLLMVVPFIFMACGSHETAQSQDSNNDVEASIELVSEKVNMTQQERTRVKISTPFGDMVAELYNETPQHRDNFIKLIKEGFYDDLLFHRVIQNFMIQGGDPDSKGAEPGARLGSGGPGYTVEAEILPQFYHKKGALSAARQGDAVNPEKRSSGSQFYVVQGTIIPAGMNPQKKNQLVQEYLTSEKGSAYKDRMDELRELAQTDPSKVADAQKEFQTIIAEVQEKAVADYDKEGPSQKDQDYANIGGTPHLDGGYTVFGEVVEGLDIIDKIAAVETAQGDRPLEDVKMTISIIE